MKTAVGAFVVLVLGYLFAAPYLTAYQIKSAADNQDSVALARHVDFPALRHSLREQMKVVLKRELAKEEMKDTQFAAYGNTFGGIMVAEMVDAYVTPDSITGLMRGEKSITDLSIAEVVSGEQSIDELMSGDKPEAEGVTGSAPSEMFSDASMSYESISEFSITAVDNESGEEMKVLLGRRGVGWKLTGVLLPL